jgi:acetyl esterase/lipase
MRPSSLLGRRASIASIASTAPLLAILTAVVIGANRSLAIEPSAAPSAEVVAESMPLYSHTPPLWNQESAATPPQLIAYRLGPTTSPGTSPTSGPSGSGSADRALGAVVICPGGGYGVLAMDHEGHQIARWFNQMGLHAFICQYRHHGDGYQHPVPLLDALRAVRMVRAHAKEWSIDPQHVGILGFSAGGHLASTVITHFDQPAEGELDEVDQVSGRPDFAVLCYPVIAFDQPFTHRGSQNNLIGEDASRELIELLSNERQVRKDTPPTFLWHTAEDTAVPPQNSLVFYRSLIEQGVASELHVFPRGRHGVGLAKEVPGTDAWPELCEQWIASLGVPMQKP